MTPYQFSSWKKFGNKIDVFSKALRCLVGNYGFYLLVLYNLLLFYGYSKTRKKYWTGSSDMADLASKCLLL